MLNYYSKKLVKRSLQGSKKIIGKNKKLKKISTQVKNVLFTENPHALYDYTRYSPSISDYLKQQKKQKAFKIKPLISIVMPTYNTPIEFLEYCIQSVIDQSYTNWELCIADDASTNSDVEKILSKYSKIDSRIKYIIRKNNGHISAATNSAIEMANGEYVSLLDHDDILWPNALFEIVSVINKNTALDLIYTDEDKIDESNKIHSYPFFKPSWSPEFLESCNYITHFSTIRRSLLLKVGCFRIGFEGAQDWDLFIRISEVTNNISHIPKILYSWRIHSNSTAMDTDAKPYVYNAQRKLLEEHIVRSGQSAVVKRGIIKQHSCIEYDLVEKPLVSIICSNENSKSFKNRIKSLVKRTTYSNFEFIIITNTDNDYKRCSKNMHNIENVKVVHVANLKKSDNFDQAIKQANGKYFIYIDTNIVVESNDWIETLLSDSQRKNVGAVSGKVVNKTKDRFMSAGYATGIYGLYAPLLEGMAVGDVHYMRGLYGQSRRNVSALDGCIMFSKEVYKVSGGFTYNLNDTFIVDFCLKLLDKGYRNVYNPFATFIDTDNRYAGEIDKLRDKNEEILFKRKWNKYIENDPFLNPNFTKTNSQLEIN